MTINHYFDHISNRPEQGIRNDLVIETIQMMGQDMLYLPRDTIARDHIFGEDTLTLFDERYVLEMYIESPEFTGPSNHLLESFGMTLPQTLDLTVSKQRFEEVLHNRALPKSGDLIFLPMTKQIFEINFVDANKPFFQLGTNHTYHLTVELFTRADETFDTGDDFIDDIQVLDNIIPSDNLEIQEEADEFLDKSQKTDMKSTADNSGFDVDDIFSDY